MRPAPEGQLGLGGTYFAANGRQEASAAIRQGFCASRGFSATRRAACGWPFRVLRRRRGRLVRSDAGRAEADPGGLAVIGPFGFSHIGRGFDGIEYVRDADRQHHLPGGAADRRRFPAGSWNELDVDFYYGAFTRSFSRVTAKSEARVFLLQNHDGRSVAKTDNRPRNVRAADDRDIRLTLSGGTMPASSRPVRGRPIFSCGPRFSPAGGGCWIIGPARSLSRAVIGFRRRGGRGRAPAGSAAPETVTPATTSTGPTSRCCRLRGPMPVSPSTTEQPGCVRRAASRAGREALAEHGGLPCAREPPDFRYAGGGAFQKETSASSADRPTGTPAWEP